MIRLAILGTRGIPAAYGGFETFAEQLSTGLAYRGFDVTVFCPSPTAKHDQCYRGVRLKFIKHPALGKFSEMFWDVRSFWQARRNFDVIYMLGVGGAFAAWIPRLFGATVWINPDGLEWKRKKFTWPERLYLAIAEMLSVLFATRIIADSTAISNYLQSRYPALKRISMIPYGAEIPAREPDQKLIEKWNLGPDGYFIVVCRLEPENHVLEIVEGFQQSNSSLPLVILGNIEKPNAYVQRLLALSSNRVRFLGTIFDKKALAALRFFARGYVHGHSVGGTNPSLLEAMACSNLVIAHDNPFNREVLGESGLFFQTSEELACVLDAIDAGAVPISHLRHESNLRILAQYQWHHIIDSYEDLLKKRYHR